MNEPNSPLIIHCTAGKDRTGVVCALLLSLCGVDDETISDEYALTDIGLSEEWKAIVIAHLGQNPVLKDNLPGARNLISAKYVTRHPWIFSNADTQIGKRTWLHS